MRLILLASVAALAACSTVEERTDRRSGSGLTQGSMAASGNAVAPEGRTVEIRMTAPEAVPAFYVTAEGATGDRTEAARLAATHRTEPMGVGVTLGGELYWLRQVRANSIEFAVAEPQGKAARGSTSVALTRSAGERIGCLATGETWVFDDVQVAALNCR